MNEQPYPELVKENFTPIILDQQRDLATQPDAVAAHGVISSDSVELMSQEVHSCDQEPQSLSMKEGAVLILPEGAQSFDLANEKTFLGEAIRHGIDWYECATEEASRLISNDSLYLITGFHKARSWSVGAAGQIHSNIQKPRSVKFKVGQIDQGRATARAYQWTATSRFTGRIGPTYPYESANHIRDERLRRGVHQTVFVRGFRITVNKILFLKTVSVKTRQGTFFGFGTYIDKLWGGPSESTPSSGADPTDNAVDQDTSMDHSRLYMDTRMTIDRLPDVSKAFHPGDSINRYMLKKEPRAMVALTHDSIWIEMLRTGLLELADFSCEKRLEEVLSKNCRIIVEDSAVYLQQEGHVFESSPRKHSECTLPSSALTGSIQTPGLPDLYPECTGREQAKDEALALGERPQHVPSFSSSATRANEEGETILTSIRVTDVALGLKQVPVGFYTVVRHSGLEWRTENKRSSANDDVEWRGPIPIPSDLSATVCLEVFASFGFQPMLGAEERVRKLAVTVQQLLDRSEKDVPFTFFPNDGDIVSRRSSILVTVKRQKGESGSSTLGVLGSVQTSPTDVISFQFPEAVIHPDVTQTIPESAPLPHSKISPNMSSVSRNLESGHREVTTPPSSSSSELLIYPPPTVELSPEDELSRTQTVSSTDSSEFVRDPPVWRSLPYPPPLLQLRPTPLTQSLQIQDGRKDGKEDDYGEGEHGEEDDRRSTTATARAWVTHLAHGHPDKPKKGKEVRQRPKRSHSAEHVAPSMSRKLSAQQQYPAQEQPPVIPKGFSGRVTASGITLNANTQPRKIIVVANTSSEEYETTDGEDSEEWTSGEYEKTDDKDSEERASEEMDAEAKALEAQRQRELFAKVSKRSYSNLNPTQSRLLSLNHPYRYHPAQFECEVCKQTFTAQFSLRRHQQEHTGERPFACGILGCTERFYNSSDCKRHERSRKRHEHLVMQ
ncbi:hypothetical protein EV363DRAFT_1420080 [Boletus edulis]|nr:hypothetical protein EV363DRAFT_1420080 [Boletus edulis]